MKPVAILFSLVLSVLLTLPLFGQETSTADTLTNLPGCWGKLETKQVSLSFNAYGKLGLSYYYGMDCGVPCLSNEEPCHNFESPSGSGHEYLFMGGIWIGGRVGTDTIVSVSIPGWLAEYEFSPVDPGDGARRGISRLESVSDYAVRSHMTDAVLASGQPNQNPLGIEVILRSHVWEAPTVNKAVIHDVIITNVSTEIIKDGFFGLFLDADIGVEQTHQYATDDLTGSIRELGIGYTIDNDGDPAGSMFDADSPRRCLAARYLATSFDAAEPTFNWWLSNTYWARDYGPQVNDSLFRPFHHQGIGTSVLDWEHYYLMAKPEWDFDNVFTRHTDSLEQDWIKPEPGLADTLSDGTEAKFLLSIGAFDLPPDSSVRLIFTTFTGADVHQNPHTMNLLPTQPSAFVQALNFTDLKKVAVAAEGLADRLLAAKAPVSGLRVLRSDNEKTTLTWDPYVFPGLSGYDIYLTEVDPGLLPYPGTCPPWLKQARDSRLASIPPIAKYAVDSALNPERLYLVNVAQRKGDSLGSLGRSVSYRPVPRAAAPTSSLPAHFIQAGDSIGIKLRRSSEIADHYNVYVLPTFADTARIFHPFYDRGEARDSMVAIDSFHIEGQTWYYYAMTPALVVNGKVTEFSVGNLADSNAIVITAVGVGGFESEFSTPIRVYEAPARTRDVLVLTRGNISGMQAYPDSIRGYYDRLLAGLDYSIYSIGDSAARPFDWPWWSELMPYRLTIVDDDLSDRVLFWAPLAQLENYALSGGHLLICGSLLEVSSAQFVSRTHGWYATDTTAQRLLGIDSVYQTGLLYYQANSAPPYVDTLGGFVAAYSIAEQSDLVQFDSTRDPLTPIIRAYWPTNTAPITAAFAVNEDAAVELTYTSLYPTQSRVNGKPVVVSRNHGPGKITTAGFHLWYMEPQTVHQWLVELHEKKDPGVDPKDEVALPDRFELAQNYPNPFNPATTIAYSLPVAGRVRLEVFNLLGQRVRILVEKQQTAGAHQVVWDGTSESGKMVASGVYFYRLTAGEFRQERKMLLLK